MDNEMLYAAKTSPDGPCSWTVTASLPQDLLFVKERVYDMCGFSCSQPLSEPQNLEYGAYTFQIDTVSVRFRIAKITPTKLGQFVTLWHRTGDGPIQPYDASDSVDYIVISTRQGDCFGQFVFPKHALLKQGILSNQGIGGKRAIRVYPPWDKPASKQAQKTQKWQLAYFLDIPSAEPFQVDRAAALYGINMA